VIFLFCVYEFLISLVYIVYTTCSVTPKLMTSIILGGQYKLFSYTWCDFLLGFIGLLIAKRFQTMDLSALNVNRDGIQNFGFQLLSYPPQ